MKVLVCFSKAMVTFITLSCIVSCNFWDHQPQSVGNLSTAQGNAGATKKGYNDPSTAPSPRAKKEGYKPPTAPSPRATNASVEVIASNSVSLTDTMNLSLTLRLNNNQGERVSLTVANPCSVFKWSVLTSGKKWIQSNPNKYCVQVIASKTLDSGQSIEQSYVVSLNSQLYISGNRYRLKYTFWGVSGYHDFNVR